jgi:hypothetical protein
MAPLCGKDADVKVIVIIISSMLMTDKSDSATPVAQTAKPRNVAATSIRARMNDRMNIGERQNVLEI